MGIPPGWALRSCSAGMCHMETLPFQTSQIKPEAACNLSTLPLPSRALAEGRGVALTALTPREV